MDEEERNKKLRAGKEKLAAFQKKKSKKKHGHHHERAATSLDHPTEMADSSSIDQSSSSDLPLFEDSDQNLMSEDEMTIQDSKSLFKAQAKLKQAIERIAELEESLEGKQLALDRVISENTKLKETSLQEKMREMEMALCKRDEIIRQLTSRLQSAASLEADAAQLGQHVQQLQTQLINAGKLMESQNYKQSLSSQALIEAKNEIETLQKCIEDKDNLLTQLSEKVNAISTEYIGLKTSYEMSRQKEDESAKVVKSLMSDAEDLRKQASMNGSVNISSPDSDIEVKVQEVRLELEETYGKQITVMKEELSKHYQAQIETLSCELNNVKQVYDTLENQLEILQQEKQMLTTSNETYTSAVSELETKLAEVNSRLDEVQNEKEEILKMNETLNEQINVINKQDVQFENANRQQKEEVLLTRKEIVSEEVEQINSITELNEKNLKLSTELENLRTEYVEAKKLIDNLQKKGKGGRSQQFQVDSQEIVMELKQVTEQYEEALVNIAMMQAKIEDYDIKCENLNDDLLKLKEKYVKSDEAIKNNEERLKEYEEKQESMVLEKQEMMEKCKNAQRQCEEYRDKFVEYEQQLTDYEGLMIQFNELQHECNVYQTQNDELNNKMNIQQDVVVELKAELEVLTNQNQAYQEQALLQTQQLGEISEENKSLQESVNQHKDELTTLTNSFNLVTAEVDVYREKANSLETMVENLNKELQMKGDAEFESEQKDVLIQELTSKISDLRSALQSDHDNLHKETVLHEECSLQKEVSLHEECLAPLSNEECALENQIIATDNVQNQSDEIDSRNIDQLGGMLQPVQIIQLEASVTSSEVPFNLIGHQSELQLGAGMEVGRDMDADSLDDNESTRTIDSIEDSSHRRNDLMTRISDLHGQNQSLVSDYKTLSDENLELKMNIQKLNDALVEMSGSKSDFEQIVQTFKSIIDKLEAEKAEMEISWKSTEECNLALSEKLKYAESNLTVVEEEKMALQSELTFMNSIINEISQTEYVSQDEALLGALHVDEGLSQTASTSHVDEGLSQTASTNMCNKLQTVKQNVNTLHQECDQLKVKILEINDIHRNELLQRQEENDNLQKELGLLDHQINDLKADEEKSKESQRTEIKMLQTENDNLNKKLVETTEREQNLRVQVDRLSQQVFELSVINQTVSGDKENLENRFVEVSAKENDALEGEVISSSGECQVLSSTISHDLFVTNQQIFPVAGKDNNDLNEKSDREVSGEMETQTNGEKDTASLDGSVNLKVVTTSLSAGSLETLSTSTADQSTDQSTTVRSTCMPTNLGQVMNVCSSVSVNSVNQLPPNYVHGLVASDAFNGKMVDNHDCQTNDCKQAENLDQKQFEKSLDLSNVTEESSFQSCSETFDQMLQVDSVERSSNDNMCSAVQNGVGISEISQTTDDGNPSQYLDQVENENENNERSEHLRNENTILKVKLEDTQNDMSEMLNDRVELVGSMENFSDKINSLRSHNKQLSHDLLHAIDENKLLRKQLIENGENSEIRCRLEDKIIELVTENQKLKAEYAKTQTLFKEEHESLKSAISSWQEATVSGQQLKEEVTGLFKEIENLSEEKHEMKIALKSMEEAYVSKQSLNEELQRQVLENSKNLKEMEKWKIHAEDLDSRCKETEEKLENEIEKWCVNVNTIECQKKEIIENLEQELEQRKIYLKELQSKTTEVEALNGQCLEVSTEKDKLLGKCKEYECCISELKTKNSELVIDKEEAMTQWSDTEKKLRSEIVELTEKCTSQEKLINELHTECCQSLEETRSNQVLFHEKELSFTKALEELNEKLNNLEKQNQDINDQYTHHRTENEKLQESCVVYETKINELNEKCSTYENQLTDALSNSEKLTQELKENCTKYEKQAKEIMEKCESSENQLSEIKETCSNYENQLSEMKETCSSYENQLSEMKESYENQLSEMKESYENQISEMKETCSNYENQLSEMKESYENQISEMKESCENQLSEIKETCSNYENQLFETKETCSCYENQLSEMKETCSNYETQLSEMKESYETQLSEMKESYGNQLSEVKESYENQLSEIKETCSNYETRLSETKETCSSYENQLSETKETCSNYETKLSEMKEAYENQLSEVKERYENQLSEMKEACSTCENQLSEMKESYENQLSEAKETCSSYENQLSEMEESCSNYENQNTVLQAKCISCEKQLIEFKESHSSCEDTLKDVNEKCTFYEKQLTELQDTHERENKELEEKLKKLNAELIEVKMEHSQLLEMKENRINEMEQTISTLSVKNQELCEKNEQQENTTEDISLKYSELLKSKELLEIKKQEELSYLSVKNDELNTNIKSLEKELKDMKVVHSELVETNTKMKNVYENKISTLSTENKELAKKCKHLELKKKAVKTKNSELVQNNNVTQEKLQRTVAELSSEKDGLTQKCQVQEQNIQSMESRLVALEQTKNVIEIELNTTKDQLLEENNHLKTNIEDLQTKNHGLVEKLETDKNHLDQVTSEFECLKVLYSETEKENTSLIVKVKEANEQSEQMQESLQEIKEELEQTQKSVLKLQEDQIELKNKKDMLEKENDHMVQEREKLSQEIEQLSDELCSVEEERNALLKSQDLTEQSLRDMKANYESLNKLLHDTKNECGNEITMLKAQLTQMSEEVHSLKACQDILQSDLSNVTSQKLQVISELEQEQREREQIFLKNSQLQQELKDKCEKDLHNQAIIDAKNEASSLNYRDTLTSCVEIAIQTDLNSNAKQEVINAETQVDFYESNNEIDHCQNRLENDGRNEHFSNEMTENLACAKAEEDGRTFNVEENVDTDNLANNVDATSQGSLVEVDNTREENVDDDELISEEELEALIQQKIDSEKKQIEYDMEEKYEIRFRQQQVELMHTFDKRQQDLEKNFEKQVNHRLESLRAEKDQAFVKALQKMKKDFEKKHRKEMEKQRLAHQHEMAIMQDERKGGGHISGVVQKLHQENQELAEARDALLQQVELSHHHQEQLEDELRSVLEEHEGDGEFLCEPTHLNTDQPRHSYRSQSLMLDWEFSPTSSFEQDKDPPGLRGQCFEDICLHPQCVVLRRKYKELINSISSSGFQPEINSIENFPSTGPGFKPEMENYELEDSDGIISTPTTKLEASFVKEAMRKAAEQYSDMKNMPSCSTPKVDAFIANVDSKDDLVISKSNNAQKEMLRNGAKCKSNHVRSLSLNLSFLSELGDIDARKSVHFVRSSSLDNFGEHLGSGVQGEFLEEDTPMQTQTTERIAQRRTSSTSQLHGEFLEELTPGLGTDKNKQSATSENETQIYFLQKMTNNTSSTCIPHDQTVECLKPDITLHNSQGEFYEEFISGEIENFDPGTINEIALIQSNVPLCQREVTPDPHSGDFTHELSAEQKLDNEKLLKKLESLKNIYCREKQELMSKCENLTIQLENESLSRIQLEQELVNINEDFGETYNKSNPLLNIKLKSCSSVRDDEVFQESENLDIKDNENIDIGVNFQDDNVSQKEHFELLIKNLKSELQEKSENLERQNVEIGMVQRLQEQRLNEIKVLYKAELRKLEIENGALMEQKYQLENQNLQLCKQLESNDSHQNIPSNYLTVASQTSNNENIGNNQKDHLCDFTNKLENCRQENEQLIEQNVQLKSLYTTLETDLQKLTEKSEERETLMNELSEKCRKYEDHVNEKPQIIVELEEKCATLQSELNSKPSVTEYSESELISKVSMDEYAETEKPQGESIFKELQEKCHNLEIELEYAKQNETFACVYEDKCKQYEAELENRKDCEEEFVETTKKCEKLQQEHKSLNLKHQSQVNSLNLKIEDLNEKCQNLVTEVENLKKQLQGTTEKCIQYEEDLSRQQENEAKLKNLEEKSKNDEIRFEEFLNKCSTLSSRLEFQRRENDRLTQEMTEKCERYEAEIVHNEKALDEIHETCSKFENAGFENEHVIQELTSQCQKYQSEIQKLRAKELLKMKTTLSCSVDEIEMTDIYQEELFDTKFSLLKYDEENKENVTESGTKQKELSISQEPTTFDEEICQQETIYQVESNQKVIESNSLLQGRITELEVLLKDKEALIRKYEAELEQRDEELGRLVDLRQYQEHIEMSIREKDSYIKQLEEHFLQQRTPVSVRSLVKQEKYGNVGKQKSEQKTDSINFTCSTPILGETESVQSQNDSRKGDLNDSFSDQSTISGDNSLSNSKSNDSLLSEKTDNKNNSIQTLSVFNSSLDGSEKIRSGLGSEGDGHLALEMKHFAIVEEISKLRQDLRETKSVYTQENALLREALDREKWKRDSRLETSFREVEQQYSSEVVTLRQKVSLLMETNNMLRNENDKWLNQVQEQETIVMQLREQVGHDVVGSDNHSESDQSFNQQLKLLQQQRNELVQKLNESENKVGTLAQNLNEKSILEETFRREKAVLQAKLYEMEEVEKELTEKKIELEKQKSTQRRLEEMIYHRDLIERELMKQKRLLEVELAEIECKLHEKEELLEIQKNQLLEEIKQNYSSDRISDTSKLLSSSLDGSDFSFDLSMMTSPLPRATPEPSKQTTSVTSGAKSKTVRPVSQYRQQGNVNRLELMLSDVEKEHAEAISYLKEKLQKDDELQGSHDYTTSVNSRNRTPKK